MPLVLALIAVGVVLYLSYVFSRYLAVGAAKINKSKNIKIIDRVVLGQDRMLLITKIGEKHFLIGSSPQSIQILTELESKDIADVSYPENMSGNIPFKDTLKGILSKKEQ
jgi:flagellar biogenesis protein FliO